MLLAVSTNSLAVLAQEVPDKKTWSVTASAEQNDQFAAEFAVDGKLDTRWSSTFDDGHWLQIDLGKPALVTGAVLHWETAYASKYQLQSSGHGRSWQTRYHTGDSEGGIDQIYFNPTTARYWRIVGETRATGWGSSLWEVELLGANQQPLASSSSASDDSSRENLLDGDLQTVWMGNAEPKQSITLDLRQNFDLTGVRVEWGEIYAQTALLEISEDGKQWQKHTELSQGIGAFDLLVDDRRSARYLRLTFGDLSDPTKLLEIRELLIQSPGEEVGSTVLYESVAKKWPAGYFPDQAVQRQTYWTVVGLPRDTEETLLDENGSIEAKTAQPMLMPFLLPAGGKLITARNVDKCEQSLVNRWLPLPSVTWQTENLRLTIEAIPAGRPGDSTTFVLYRVANFSDQQQRGQFFLAVRPHQINPRWQHGGIARTRSIRADSIGENQHAVIIDDAPIYVVLDRPTASGATEFSKSRGDIVQFIAAGLLPDHDTAECELGLASAAFSFDYDIAPGANRDVVVAVPLHENAGEVAKILLNNRPSGTTPSEAFNQLKKEQIGTWHRRLAKVKVRVGDREVTDTLRAQAGYILINQDGNAIQPGSRNYNRSWIRDGSLTATALMRLGMFDETRQYLEWYTQRVEDNGLVPPILNTDGSLWHGYGDVEYDAQGQYVYLVANQYRLSGDEEFLRKYFDQLISVMRHTAELCQQTRRPEHMAGEPARERFQGILPPSVSHEGYATPAHSYWDDYWALKGWCDLRDVAARLGRQDIVDWSSAEYDKLVEAVQATIDATVQFKQIDFLPSSADYGDPDPTSISIGIYPCGQIGMMRRDLLMNTYDRYYEDLERRTKPGANYGYTPYEVRNMMSFALLNQPARAEQLLDFLMEGRRPAAWRHFAEVVHSDERIGKYIGDMPHTWVGSGFVNTILGMIFVEQRDELRLLVAPPEKWLLGKGIVLRDVPTHFGRLNLDARIVGDSLQLEIGGSLQGHTTTRLSWPWASRPRSVSADGNPVEQFDDGSVLLLPDTKSVLVQW